MEGLIIDTLSLEDGILVPGSSQYFDNGWMAYFAGDGSIRRLPAEEGCGAFSCPIALGQGYSG